MPILGPPGALSPKDWRALVDYDTWNDLYTPDDGVVLHHGGGSDYPAARSADVADEIQQLQQWESFHIYGRGWRGLAYGWGVGQSGTIYRIRGWNRYGAHLGDVDGDGIANNDELIPIIWIASGNHHTVSDAADEAISHLRQWILESAPSALRFYGHKEVQLDKPTACPGPNGMAYVNAHRLLPEEDDMTVAEWAAAAWEWGKKIGVLSDSSMPKDDLPKEEFIVHLKRYDANVKKRIATVSAAAGASTAVVIEEIVRRLS